MLKISSTVTVILGVGATACAQAAGTNHHFSSSSYAASSQGRSEGVLAGGNGRLFVNGDVVEVKGGAITVNGVSYGKVSPDSRVRYIVEGQQRQLFVDNEERKPQR